MARQKGDVVSALFDNEATPQEIEHLLRLESTDEISQTWVRYRSIAELMGRSSIGDLRVDLVAGVREGLAAERVDSHTTAAPQVVPSVTGSGKQRAAGAGARKPGPWYPWRIAGGIGLAASLVLMILAGFHIGGSVEAGLPQIASNSEPSQTVASEDWSTPAGDAMAVEAGVSLMGRPQQVSRETALEEFLLWHAEQSSMTGPRAALPVARLASYGGGSEL